MSWVKVYSAASGLQAHCIKGLLATKGIECLLQGESLAGAAGEIPLDQLAVDILVYPTQTNRALELIKQFEADNTGDDWVCPNCQESNAANFEFCWACQHQPQS